MGPDFLCMTQLILIQSSTASMTLLLVLSTGIQDRYFLFFSLAFNICGDWWSSGNENKTSHLQGWNKEVIPSTWMKKMREALEIKWNIWMEWTVREVTIESVGREAITFNETYFACTSDKKQTAIIRPHLLQWDLPHFHNVRTPLPLPLVFPVGWWHPHGVAHIHSPNPTTKRKNKSILSFTVDTHWTGQTVDSVNPLLILILRYPTHSENNPTLPHFTSYLLSLPPPHSISFKPEQPSDGGQATV